MPQNCVEQNLLVNAKSKTKEINTVWQIQALQLKICDSHLTCKIANKCLNVREQVEVVEWNKKWSPPFPCCPVSRERKP